MKKGELRMMKWMPYFLFSVFFASFVQGQDLPTTEVEPVAVNPVPTATSVFKGLLLEKGTKKPLGGVNIFVLPYQLKTVTESDGRFSLEGVPLGEAKVIINLSGYNKLEKKEIFLESEVSEAKERVLYLEKSSYQVYETTITAQAKKRDGSVKTLKQEQFVNMPGTGGDPVKAVQVLPGVNRTSGFSSRVVIQGSGPDDTNYQIDDHEVPILFHFGGFSSVVFPEAVDRVETFSAGYGPELGRANGGWVGLWTRSPRGDRFRGIGFVDLINAGALIEGPAGKDAAFLFSARQSYIGYVLNQFISRSGSSGFDLTVVPAFTDVNGVYENQLTEKDKLKVVLAGSWDRLELLLKEPAETDPAFRGTFSNSTNFYRIIPQYERKLGEDEYLRQSIAFGRDVIDVDAGANKFSLDIWSLTTRGEYETRLLPSWKTYIGYDNLYRWSKFNIALPNTYSEGGISNPFSSGDRLSTKGEGKTTVIGLYDRNELRFAESPWTYYPNLRYDFFKITKEHVVSPRPSIKYDFGDGLSTRVASGVYYQPPEERETSDVYGNPDLKAPRAIHYALGVDKDFGQSSGLGLFVSGEAFYKKLDRLVVQSLGTVSRGGASVPERYNNGGYGDVVGVQTQVRYDQTPWMFAFYYTLSKSRRWQEGKSTYDYEYDQRHVLNTVGAYDFIKNWRFSAKFRFATGKPTTPITGATLDSDHDVYIPIRGDFYSKRTAATYQLDVRIDKKVIYDEWILSFYLDIQNALNTKNPEGVNYAYDYSKSEAISGLPFFPTFGVKGEF